MKDEKRTKDQLLTEVRQLRKSLAETEPLREEIGRLKQVQERFAKAFLENSIPLGITTIDEGRFVDVNRAFLKLLGFQLEEVLGETSTGLGLLTGEQRTLFFNELNTKGRVENLELQVRAKSGALFHGLFNSVLIDMGGRKHLLTVMTDITEREQAESRLRESENRFRAVADYTPDWESWVGPDGRLIWVNPSVHNLTGYSVDECLQMSDYPAPLVHEADREMLISAFRTAVSGLSGQNVVFRILRKDGGIKWAGVSWQPIYTENGVSLGHRASIRDLTDQRRLYDELAASERKYRDIFENVPVGLFQSSPEGRFLHANRHLAEILGYDSPEDLMRSVTDMGTQIYADPKDRDEAVRILRENGFIANFEARFRRKDGHTAWGSLNVRTIRDDKGDIIYFEGSSTDITARREAEQQQRFLSAITANMSDSIVATDANFAITYMNKKAEAMFGYSIDELRGRTPGIFNADPRADEIQQELYKTVSTGNYYIGESLNRRKDGSTFFCEYRVFPLAGEDGTPYAYVGLQQDITERKKLEQELIKARDELEAKVTERTRKLEAINLAFMRELKERNRLEAIWKKAEFITNSSGELMTLINRHYIFEAVNDAYCRAQGRQRDEIIGKTASEMWGEGRFNRFIRPKLDRCLKGEVIKDEDWIEFPTIGRRYFTVTYYPYSHSGGRATHVSVITHDITERKTAEDSLKKQEQDLKHRALELEEANTALRVFFRQHSEDQKKVEEKLQLNVNELVMPYIEKLKQQNMGKQYLTYLELLEINLQNIVSPFMKNLSAAYQNLTPQEIQIAEMIRQGKSSQEMAAVLNLSVRTVNTHRNNMRKKLNLKNRSMNLRSYLLSLS